MVPKWQPNLPAFQTRTSALACLLLLLLGMLVRPLSAQGPGTPIIFSDEDIQDLVDVFNDFRGRVEPTARNMQAVVSLEINAHQNR